ncbi:MAG: GNAT family N-acyltransferase [Acidobacteriota bacterium]
MSPEHPGNQEHTALRPFPPAPELIPTAVLTAGSYRLRFAQTPEELDRLLRLRFEIFNLELDEGLATSYATGRDEDEFDRVCHHLLVEHAPTGELVGTYRLQTAEMAAVGAGFYTDGEFALDGLPAEVIAQGIELGRAAIAREHRKRPVLFLLWRGLALYVTQNRKRFLFGCCSVTSQDPRDGWRAQATLAAGDHLHPTLSILARPGFECVLPESAGDSELAPADSPLVLPALFDMYLRYGGKIAGGPVIDRAFGTIDFLLLFDVMAMEEKSRRLFFDNLPGDSESPESPGQEG